MRLLYTFILLNFEIISIICNDSSRSIANESFGKNATQMQARCYTCEFKWNRDRSIALGDKRCIDLKNLSQLSFINYES